VAKKRNNIFWRVIVLALLMVSFYYWRPLTQVADRAAAQVAGWVLWRYHGAATWVHSIDSSFQSKQSLQRLLIQAEQERAELAAQLTQLRAQQRCYEDIHELVAYREKQKELQSSRIVHVVLKHVDADGHYFLINSGANHGLTLNMIAVINNHLVGRISELYPAYAKIQLITDKTLKVAACCAQTKAYGIFAGLGHPKQAALNFVDHLQEVVMGDMVLSSGIGLLYPAGLCLGTITHFVKKDINYDITVQPLIDLESLSYCFLLPPVLINPAQSLKS